MNHYYVIGVGGVGARIMEAIVRLCECGYISQEEAITCLLIDADTHCGNSRQTVRLLDHYSQCRRSLNDNNIFKTPLRGFTTRNGETTFATSPIYEDTLTTRENIVGRMNRKAYNFMLAAYDEDEYAMNVTDGFYGRPTVGSLIFAWRTGDGGVISQLISEITQKTANDGDKVYVFLTGSLFGGTGASGLPTIANAIREQATNSDNLFMSAGLMLPYFKYDTTDNPKGEIDHNNFAINAQNAINFYKNQMEKGKFNEVCMLGDYELLVRGKYATKGSDQLNMPHILELFAAGQVKQFFERAPQDIVSYRNTKWYADPFELKGNALSELVWTDYSDGSTLRDVIEKFIRFNYYYSMYIVPYIFDYEGRGEPFASQNHAGSQELPQWFYHGSLATWKWRWVFGIPPKNVVECTGKNGDIDQHRELFENMYEYLTDSAKWYYNLVHKFDSDSKICSKCAEATCVADFAGTLRSCVNSNNTLLPKLFGVVGAEMLARRASLPHWLNKLTGGRGEKFQIEASNFVQNIPAGALYAPVSGHPSFDRMEIGSQSAIPDTYNALVNSIYDLV